MGGSLGGGWDKFITPLLSMGKIGSLEIKVGDGLQLGPSDRCCLWCLDAELDLHWLVGLEVDSGWTINGDCFAILDCEH